MHTVCLEIKNGINNEILKNSVQLVLKLPVCFSTNLCTKMLTFMLIVLRGLPQNKIRMVLIAIDHRINRQCF